MRIHVHDFSGHPFQVQLSRELASRGHHVVHAYCTQYVSGHGRLSVTPDDPDTLRIEGVTAPRPLIKYSPVGRTRFELSYAGAWQRVLDADHADLVVACNVPMFTLARMRRWFAARRQPWVLWHQDLYSLAVGAEAARKVPAPAAKRARAMIERIEQRQVRAADSVVAITEAMVERYRDWGLHRERVHVVPNWAPLDDIVPGDRDNAWAKEHELPSDSLRLLYAGTLGRKHNPLLLLDILDGLRGRGVAASLVVASEGDGVDELARAADGRADVRIVGYQPTERFNEMLASADAVVALLEPEAAQFSVPSKVLSYLSAGRAIVALVPSGNAAADDVRTAGGFVGEPTTGGASAAADWLADRSRDDGSLARIGRDARALAVERFDINGIGDTFESILAEALDVRSGLAGAGAR